MEKHVMQYQTVHFNLNGKDVERTVDVRTNLTDMLRNDSRMTSVKKGCEVGGAAPAPASSTVRPITPASIWRSGWRERTSAHWRDCRVPMGNYQIASRLSWTRLLCFLFDDLAVEWYNRFNKGCAVRPSN